MLFMIIRSGGRVVCIECLIVLCHCYLGVFEIDRTVFWFVLLSIVLVIVFAEVLSTVECLCSWGIWGSCLFFGIWWLSGCGRSCSCLSSINRIRNCC